MRRVHVVGTVLLATAAAAAAFFGLVSRVPLLGRFKEEEDKSFDSSSSCRSPAADGTDAENVDEAITPMRDSEDSTTCNPDDLPYPCVHPSLCSSATCASDAEEERCHPSSSSSSSSAGNSNKGSSSYRHVVAWTVHGFLAFAAYAVLLPTTIAAAWFRRCIPGTWIYIHAFGNMSSWVLSVLAVVVAFAAVQTDVQGVHLSHGHHAWGWFALLLSTVQVTNGLLRPAVERIDPFADPPAPESEDPDDDGEGWRGRIGRSLVPKTPRQRWLMLHRILGLATLTTGLYQVHGGVRLLGGIVGMDATLWLRTYYSLVGSSLVLLMAWAVWDDRDRAAKMRASLLREPDIAIDKRHAAAA